MAVHALAAVLMKRPLLHLLFRLSPLLWPFNLYLPPLRQLPNAALAASSLLLFRIRRIVAVRVPRYRRAVHQLWDELGADGGGLRRPSVLDDRSLQSLLSVAI